VAGPLLRRCRPALRAGAGISLKGVRKSERVFIPPIRRERVRLWNRLVVWRSLVDVGFVSIKLVSSHFDLFDLGSLSEDQVV